MGAHTLKVGPRKVGGPTFRAFFFPLPPQFSLFLSGCLLVEFWWCLERRNLKCARVGGVLGLSCETPAAPKPPGVHTTDQNQPHKRQPHKRQPHKRQPHKRQPHTRQPHKHTTTQPHNHTHNTQTTTHKRQHNSKIHWPKMDWLNLIGQSLPLPPKGWRAQKFALFFPLSRHCFHSFFSLFGVFSWNLWCSKRRGPESTFGVLGLSCEAPAAPETAGVSHDSTFEGPGLQKHHQNSSRRHPNQRKKKNEHGAGEGKQRAKFWGILAIVFCRPIWANPFLAQIGV